MNEHHLVDLLQAALRVRPSVRPYQPLLELLCSPLLAVPFVPFDAVQYSPGIGLGSFYRSPINLHPKLAANSPNYILPGRYPEHFLSDGEC